MSHFKTQQEIWKYLADGGTVINDSVLDIIKFENGKLNTGMKFIFADEWSPYHEPAPKTKVWRWEKITINSDGSVEINQNASFLSEDLATEHYPGFTKIPGSEREI